MTTVYLLEWGERGDAGELELYSTKAAAQNRARQLAMEFKLREISETHWVDRTHFPQYAVHLREEQLRD